MTSLALMASLCVIDVLNCLKKLRAPRFNLGPKPFALCQFCSNIVLKWLFWANVDQSIVVSLNYSRPTLNIQRYARNTAIGVCEQQKHRPACALAQSDQRLCYSLIE